MSGAFLIVGCLTSMLGWVSSLYYDDCKLDLQCAGVGLYLVGGALKFWWGL